MEREANNSARDEMWRGIGVGLSLGTVVGILSGGFAVWMTIGSAVGIVLGSILSRKR